jgi:hypothetical protein
MASLFDRKRAQLCAVWVTSDSSDSMFQVINSSVRKYDSLRGKYISAYVDTLLACNQRNELETLLKWVYSTRRDLPSYFAQSAAKRGGKPEKAHIQDCILVKSHAISSYHFLTAVKRRVNSALASIVLNEIQGLSPKDTKNRENLMKLAYACYLRLNCVACDVTKGRELRSHRTSGSKVVVKALTAAYVQMGAEVPLSSRPSEWGEVSQVSTFLEAALAKCRSLFPTLSANYYSTKGVALTKGEKGRQKRKAPENPIRSFEVAIPQGLAAGDKFLTSIHIGDKVKKVRLTVPEGASDALRFSLRVDQPGNPENVSSGNQAA